MSDGEAPRQERRAGLVVNADDWGLDRHTTDSIRTCLDHGGVTSTSAMVFMSDSERAAEIALSSSFDCGLHLNLTQPLTGSAATPRLAEQQRAVAAYLRSHRLAQIIYHPGLRRAFEYVVRSQIDEFRRLYGQDPKRIDGHHHMHLCANVQWQQLLPCGTILRRNFSFAPGERSFLNRWYRGVGDRRIARRHLVLDYLFYLPAPGQTERLENILSLARAYTVEMETHPARPEEMCFLLSKSMSKLTQTVHLSTYSGLLSSGAVASAPAH
jgi:predicted glycoside hydrolase/deacetylase ChbG (UPF0249 family)